MATLFSSLRLRLVTPVLVALVPAWVFMLYRARDHVGALLGLLLATALAAVVAWLVGDVFVLRPLRSVVQTAARLKDGDLSARAGLGRIRGEIGQLARTLDDMAQTLEERTLDLLKANGDLQFEVVERKRAQEALQRDQAVLQEAERRFRETLENVKLLSVGLDPVGSITFCNDLFLRVTGWERDEILGRDWFELFVTDGSEDKDAFLDAVRRGSVFPYFENRIKARDGRIRFVAWSNVVLRTPEGGVVGTVSIGDDVTEQREAARQLKAALADKEAAAASLALVNAELEANRAELHELAIHDELTGLLNRREMNRLLEEEISRLLRYGNPVALLIMDIDHFKTLNDTYGHGAGDQALRWVARLLRSTLRAADRGVRYGGDELVVILPGLTAPQAHQMAERFRQSVHSGVFRYPEHAEKGVEISVTLSIGAAGLPDHGTTAEGLLLAADRALYEAKRLGRDRTVTYSAPPEAQGRV